MASSLIGRTLGKYEITELLGRGGMATVYKGYQREIDRYVAIKVLPPHPGQDPQFVERFRLEARTVARLQHPHILPLYDYGIEDDILYLVMAYVEGGTLSDRIDRGPMPLPEVEQVLRQMASALDYAHRQGVIHRDIKPDNILLDNEGHALLSDFGIVKIVEGDTNLTGTGGMVGTPAYMAPEQGRGERVTNTADIYSLGVVVYEMITGTQPYQAETPMQIVIKHMNDPVPSLSRVMPELPPGIELVMQRVLAKDPTTRYQTAIEFTEDFARALHSDDTFIDLQAKLHAVPDETLNAQQPRPSPESQQTVIVQTGGSSLILLGGFAILAVMIVAVMILLLNNTNRDAFSPDAGAPSQTAPGSTTQAVAAAPTAIPLPTFGNLSFGMANVSGDTATLRVENLRPLSEGAVYTAWLQSTDDGSLLKLGEIRLDALGNGALVFTDPEGRNLPTIFNALIITAEQAPGDAPMGPASYSGSVPAAVALALNEILVTSQSGVTRTQGSGNTAYGGEMAVSGEKGGLLYSAVTEASLAQQHAGLAADATSVGGMHTHAEHTINILLGTRDDYDGNGRGENPGRGFGVLRFLDLIDEQLNQVLSGPQTPAKRSLEINAELIRVCLVNVRTWTQQVVDLEHQLLASNSIEAVTAPASQAQALAATIINGVDLNENGQVEPYEGECGLQQISTYSIILGSIDLVEGPLPDQTA